MDLKTIITMGKISGQDQLTKAGQREVASDPELQALIDENAAFNNVVESCPATPDWHDLRDGVLARATDILIAEEEQQRIEQLPFFRRINTTNPWFAQALTAAALVAIICILAYLFPYNQPDSSDMSRVSQRGSQWYNYAMASRSGQGTEERQQRVTHP